MLPRRVPPKYGGQSHAFQLRAFRLCAPYPQRETYETNHLHWHIWDQPVLADWISCGCRRPCILSCYHATGVATWRSDPDLALHSFAGNMTVKMQYCTSAGGNVRGNFG